MPNPALTEKIRNLPPLLDSLERDAEVSDLLRRSDAARERFRQMFPLDGVEQSALEDYRKEWMARYVYNSNAIEGSTLTLEDTELVLEGEFVPTDSPARYIFAARGVADGMAYAERFAEEERTLSVEMIQKLHEVTALDMQPALRGRFRPYGYQARITAFREETANHSWNADDLASQAGIGPRLADALLQRGEAPIEAVFSAADALGIDIAALPLSSLGNTR